MVKVFQAAGFTQHSQLEDGVIRVVMDISPTSEALSALYERDRKAAARSMQRLLRPRSMAVIGASRSPGTVGHELVRNLVAGGFQGPVYPVNPTASHIASVPCFARIDAIPGAVDLAIVAVPARPVLEVVDAVWPQRRGWPGYSLVSLRRGRGRGGGIGAPGGPAGPLLRDAGGGPELLRCAQHGPRRLHERHLCQGHADGRQASGLLPSQVGSVSPSWPRRRSGASACPASSLWATRPT